MKKVIILGGGVGGMSAAHMLARSGFEVTVYEKAKHYVGGKARSEEIEGTDTCPGDEKLPGEHGFRFFPGFYKHITETLKEIPAGNGGTVFDNLVPTQTCQLCQAGKSPVTLPLDIPMSLDEVGQLFAALKRLTGRLTDEEVDFFKERVWQLMTSCEERFLGEYEGRDWREFTDAHRFGVDYRELLVKGLTRSLTAAQAEIASTRTIGTMLIQMLYTLIDRTPDNADLVLNAPTNEAWLDPWYDYLDGQGVDYRKNHELREVVMESDTEGAAVEGIKVWNHETGVEVTDQADYYVLAVPLDIASGLLQRNPGMLAADPSLQGIIDLSPDVRWMNGIQFFLSDRFDMHCGHTIFATSNWAITSISQVQFWPDFDLTNRFCGEVRGILSCAISDWFSPGNFNNKPAKDCSRFEVAEEAFKQIQQEVNVCGRRSLTEDMLEFVFVDSSIYDLFPSRSKSQRLAKMRIDQDDGIPIRKILQLGNREPMLVNLKNRWHLRPNASTRIPNLVLASDYVKTNIDLASMEGANEAAREATNYIIDHSGSNAAHQVIKPMETPWFLKALQRLDLERWRDGKPWRNPIPFFW